MDLQHAIAIVLAYDVVPKSLLEDREKISLAAAQKVVKEAAYRASSDFMQQEASKKYWKVTVDQGLIK